MVLEKLPEVSDKPRLSTRLIVAIILGATVLVAAAFAVGRASVPIEPTPASNSAEAGFSRDMQTHHLQAVEMSLIVRDLTDDPEIRLLAYDIATAQAQQAGQMHAWLSLWGLPQASPEPVMTWMSRPTLEGKLHDHSGDTGKDYVPGDPMPGLATNEQMETLKSLTGVEAEKYFLELMIAHHIGGVEMAEAILERSSNRAVTNLSRGMVVVQEGEINYMRDLLAERQ